MALAAVLGLAVVLGFQLDFLREQNDSLQKIFREVE
jgi:hypothetical protein